MWAGHIQGKKTNQLEETMLLTLWVCHPSLDYLCLDCYSTEKQASILLKPLLFLGLITSENFFFFHK